MQADASLYNITTFLKTFSASGTSLISSEIFSNGKWLEGPTLPTALYGASASMLQHDTVILCGGANDVDRFASTFLFTFSDVGKIKQGQWREVRLNFMCIIHRACHNE